ncbi:hypothetical protein GCM10011395_00410 [Sphingomonas psychrolutea]|uniref:Fe2OG dioxygenase domain-containing protein n=1 Tax=Sphingomonas psychrolutea TaxID=1259676 RepID=A0ABQ1FYS7_9SPHN|nr:hypothetical protein GCM10011395_00410 [Sphingomonas psychrolutea]
MKRARRLVELLWTQPDYIFGRFLMVRRLYSASRRLVSAPLAGSLRISRIYSPETEPIVIAASDLVISDKTVDAHCASLQKTAWSDRIGLSAAAVSALTETARTTRLLFKSSGDTVEYAPSLEALSLERRKSAALAQVADGWQDATLQAIAGDPAIVSVVSKYLGYIPDRASVFFFWSFANTLSREERIARNQTVDFHYDVDGYNFVYVSFYLVDVDRNGGAHALIERTHKSKRLGHLLGTSCLSDAEAEAEFGAASIITVEAPAGSGFFEDTSCYHKALVPTHRDRLMLQIRYQ